MSLFTRHEPTLPTPEQALPGRAEPLPTSSTHVVFGTPLKGPWPAGAELAVFANGCFWGTEEDFWQLDGVLGTAVGYAGGITPNPTYEEVCSGLTGHAEAALVVFDPQVVSYEQLLKLFWEHHDPTQGMRQGNDIGTQYRSAIFTTTEAQLATATASRERYAAVLAEHGRGAVTTEVRALDPASEFWYAEEVHQQYLAKNPHGYRCHSATGIAYEPVSVNS